MTELKEAIRARALECGFDVVGFARAEANPEDARNLRRYLAEGRHGDMAWMARTAERRADPKALWPDARSVICLGVNYGPAEDPRGVHGEPERGAISVYARGRDYHDVLKKRLKAFAGWLAETHGCAVKVFVDTAPVMEKPLAMRAGLGWIGKHTNLVSRRFGSWLFLGEVFTTLELPADPPEVDHCGTCDACLRACPTEALPEPYRIEPRRCISYLTIEHEGAIAPEIARRSATASTAATTVWPPVPGTSSPRRRRTSPCRRAPTSPRRSSPSSRTWTRRRSAPASTAPRSSGADGDARNVRNAAQRAGNAPATLCAGIESASRPTPQTGLGRRNPWGDRVSSRDRRGRLDDSRSTSRPRPTLYLAASTLANWLSASRCRSFGICVKLRASSRHIRWRIVRSSSLPFPSRPSKK